MRVRRTRSRPMLLRMVPRSCFIQPCTSAAVLFLDFAPDKLAGQPAVRFVAFGHHQQSAGGLVQAMHDSGAQFAAHGRQLAKVMQQRVHQGAAIALVVRRAGPGMYGHAGRLVHYSQIGVFEHDIQRDIFRHRAQGRLRSGPENGNTLTAAQPQRRARHRIIHQHQLLRDELLHPGPAGLGKMRRQKLVQPFAGVLSGRGNQ